MWEISNANQIISFLRSVIFGGMFCLLFDFFRALRKSINHSALAVFIEDVFCFVVYAPLTFCFLLATTNGELRFYIFFGMITGFVIVRMTLSALSVAFFNLIFTLLKKLFGCVNRVFIFVSGHIFSAFIKIKAIISKKALNIRKKLLKKQ